MEVVQALLQAKTNLFLKTKDRKKSPIDLAKNNTIKQCILNHPWYHRRSLIVMRPHADHTTNKKHRMTIIGWLVTAQEKGDEVELFHLRRMVASFL